MERQYLRNEHSTWSESRKKECFWVTLPCSTAGLGPGSRDSFLLDTFYGISSSHANYDITDKIPARKPEEASGKLKIVSLFLLARFSR